MQGRGRGQTQQASPTEEKEKENTRYRSGKTVRIHIRSKKRTTSAGCFQEVPFAGSARREDKEKAGATSGSSNDNIVNGH